MGRVAICVPSYDRIGYLFQTLCAIEDLAGMDDFEIRVLSNGSSDGTEQALAWWSAERTFPHMRYWVSPQNVGNGGGLQRLADEEPETALLMQNDNDIVPKTPGYLRMLVGLLEARPEAGIVGARITGIGTKVPALGPVQSCPVNGGTEQVLFEPVALTTACLLLRREAWVAIGQVFRADQLTAPVDWDLCQRVARAGYMVYRCPDIVAHHIEGTDGQGRRFRHVFHRGHQERYLKECDHCFPETTFSRGETP